MDRFIDFKEPFLPTECLKIEPFKVQSVVNRTRNKKQVKKFGSFFLQINRDLKIQILHQVFF